MRTIRLLAGSVAVYAIVACGSAAMGPTFGDGQPDASTARLFDAGLMIGALADALASPVAEAAAAPLPPISATESCSKQTMYAGQTATYAEHSFPGYTAAQLTAVRTLVTMTTTVVPGYTQEQGGAWVRDGYAAVFCGIGASPSITSVTFILP